MHWFAFDPSSPLLCCVIAAAAVASAAVQSGISPNQETLAQVEELRKNNSKYFFATFKVDGVEIVPDVQYGNAEVKALTEGALTDAFKATVWPEFVKTLTTANGPRFGVIDFAYTTKVRATAAQHKITALAEGCWMNANGERTFSEPFLLFLCSCVCFPLPGWPQREVARQRRLVPG